MASIIKTTPRHDGFRMPGEFEAHQGCWMLWPQRGDTWRLGAKPAQAVFAQVAEAIAQFEPVSVGVNQSQYENARALLPRHIRVIEISSNDAWMRDVGPTFVIDDKDGVRGIDWEFNAWGGLDKGLYFPWDLDNQVAGKVLELEGLERYRAPLVLEGGSIHVDGQGTLITTRECLLNPNRNPSLGQDRIETYLRAYLNVRKIIWIEKGVYADETDGHVDNLCCFIKPGEVLLTWTDDPKDPQHEISEAAHQCLSSQKDARGREIRVHKIHQPGPLLQSEDECRGLDHSPSAKPRKAGDRLAGSYVNFYMPNGGIVMPLFDDPHDAAALKQMQKLFPDRKVVGVPSREVLLGGGNIHCITQQQPKG
jgi:agmatine deiminase